ncbi:MAG: sulfatase-like hydrolase/transferase [Rikenellaceae bacterium]
MKTTNKLLLAAGAISLYSCTTATSKNADKPNVIFILVDDLGKEWVDEYGAEGISLPHLQELADESMIFNRAYSMPQSTPSRVALMTSQYPYNNGWINHYDVPRWGYGAQYDVENNPCFPRQIQENGYKTCVTGKWQLNDFRLQPNIMNDLGFDEYFMWTGAESGNEKISGERYWNPYIHSTEGSKVYEGAFGPDLYCKFITDFIDKNHKDPMFIYYPMTLTHSPFVHTPHKMDAKSNYQKHIAMTEYMDIIVGRIVKSLKDNGVYDNTYIMFTTDNGTSGACVGIRNGVIVRGGKTKLSENGINCPFMVKTPKSNKKVESNALIDFTDVGPTIIEITGSKRMKERVDGVSFANVLSGKVTQSDKGYALSMGGSPAMIDGDKRVKNITTFRDRTIIGEQYKIIVDLDRSINRVYDIVNDPFERNNLVGDAKVMAAVERELGAVIKALPAQDQHPKYDVIPHDPALDYDLNSQSDSKRDPRSGFTPTATQEEYDRFVYGKKK